MAKDLNRLIPLKCVSQSFDGKGIVKYRNNEFKIENMLKGEEGLFTVTKDNVPELKELTLKSKNRMVSRCPFYLECGGCQYQHMTYEEEINLKTEYLKDLFKNFKDIKISKVTSMPTPYYYRNKCQMTYKMSKSKNVVCGFYEEGTHKVVPVVDCKIQAKKVSPIVVKINQILTKNKIEVYDEKRRTGVIRHMLIRYGFNSKEILLVFVTNGEFFPGRKNVVNDIIKANLGITTIVQNINQRDTSIVLSDKERVLYGKGYIYDTIGETKFKISARSFYQVNPVGMQILYKKAIEKAEIKNTDLVLDTYCGVGTIGILASKYAKNVIGVELNKDAVKDAEENARLNSIKNIRFINSDSTKFMTEYAQNNGNVDVLIMDPPREGSTKEFINALSILRPKKVVYVSCDPKTLERDVYFMSKIGYHLNSVEGVDMFPRTFNLETVALLTKKLSDKN